MTRPFLLFAAISALISCSGYEDEASPQAVSQTEREALEDAAEMLEYRRLPEIPPSSADAASDDDQDLEIVR